MSHIANVIDVTEATFEQDVIQKSYETPVVVDFWAAWCGPCRMLGPLLERLAAEPGANFVLAKVDVDTNQQLSMQYGIRGIPAVKAFKDGRVVNEFVGAQPEPRVRQFLSQIAPSETELSLESANNLLADRKWQQAEERFSQLLSENGDYPEAALGLTKALLGQGKATKAKTQLETLVTVPGLMRTAETLLPLADYLKLVEGRESDTNLEMTPIEAQYRQSARLFSQGKLAPALDGLLDVLRYNKDYRKGQARSVLLGIFEFLGSNDPLTTAYRQEMASILF
ncbi:MAG: thioredoxin [Candidatus Promineifilaceae bacterium]